MTDTPVLEARGASLSYPTRRGPILAVDRADLRVGAGEFIAIIGSSGSGKSTLLALLAGLCRPSAGETLFNGRPWSYRPGPGGGRAGSVGLVPQDGGLLPGLRVVDNVLLPAVLAGKSQQEARSRAMGLLERFGLDSRWDAYPAELSGGQRRRVAIARALVAEPAVILADEPTGDLDELAAARIAQILGEIRSARKTAVVVVTHDPVVARMADRVVRVRGGQCLPVEVPPADPLSASVTGQVDLGLSPAGEEDRTVGGITAGGIFEPAPAGLTPAEPGSGMRGILLGWLVFLAGVALALAVVAVLDRTIAGGQRAVVREAKAQRKLAEEMALQDLRADVEDVTMTPDARVSVIVFLQNYRPDRPLHLLGPSLEAGVQRNGRWEAIPLQVQGEPVGIRTIAADKATVTARFDIPAGRNDELLPGYLHLRIGAAMVVSDQPGGGGDLFDRQDAYYLYLRDPRRTEEEVRRANGWGEKSAVPLWISMPSH